MYCYKSECDGISGNKRWNMEANFRRKTPAKGTHSSQVHTYQWHLSHTTRLNFLRWNDEYNSPNLLHHHRQSQLLWLLYLALQYDRLLRKPAYECQKCRDFVLIKISFQIKKKGQTVDSLFFTSHILIRRNLPHQKEGRLPNLKKSEKRVDIPW